MEDERRKQDETERVKRRERATKEGARKQAGSIHASFISYYTRPTHRTISHPFRSHFFTALSLSAPPAPPRSYMAVVVSFSRLSSFSTYNQYLYALPSFLSLFASPHCLRLLSLQFTGLYNLQCTRQLPKYCHPTRCPLRFDAAPPPPLTILVGLSFLPAICISLLPLHLPWNASTPSLTSLYAFRVCLPLPIPVCLSPCTTFSFTIQIIHLMFVYVHTQTDGYIPNRVCTEIFTTMN